MLSRVHKLNMARPKTESHLTIQTPASPTAFRASLPAILRCQKKSSVLLKVKHTTNQKPRPYQGIRPNHRHSHSTFAPEMATSSAVVGYAAGCRTSCRITDISQQKPRRYQAILPVIARLLAVFRCARRLLKDENIEKAQTPPKYRYGSIALVRFVVFRLRRSS